METRLLLEGNIFRYFDYSLSQSTFEPVNNILIQWGSEIRPFKNRNHSKTGLFEDRLSNGPVFKWLGLQSIPFENRPFENRTF